MGYPVYLTPSFRLCERAAPRRPRASGEGKTRRGRTQADFPPVESAVDETGREAAEQKRAGGQNKSYVVTKIIVNHGVKKGPSIRL